MVFCVQYISGCFVSPGLSSESIALPSSEVKGCEVRNEVVVLVQRSSSGKLVFVLCLFSVIALSGV